MPIDLRKKSIIIIGTKPESEVFKFLRHNIFNKTILYTPSVSYSVKTIK